MAEESKSPSELEAMILQRAVERADCAEVTKLAGGRRRMARHYT